MRSSPFPLFSTRQLHSAFLFIPFRLTNLLRLFPMSTTTLEMRPHLGHLGVRAYGKAGPKWDVSLSGETIVEGSSCPLLDACMYLFERGVTGKVAVYARGEGQPRYLDDIERVVSIAHESGNKSFDMVGWQGAR